MTRKWDQIELAGHRVDVYPPTEQPPAGVVMFLHGWGLETLADAPEFTRVLDELGLPSVCPMGGRSWWVDRLCPEFDPALTPQDFLLDHVLPWVEREWGIAPPRVALLGISMGGQAALRLAFRFPDRFPTVAAISAAIDYHELYGRGTAIDHMYESKEHCRHDTATLHVDPERYPPHIFFAIDPTDVDWYRGNDRLHEKLSALGIEHECDLTTRAGGHSWDYFNSQAEPALRFLHRGLLSRRRRLV